MGFRPSWDMEASRVRGRVRVAAQKGPERDDRQTDRRTHDMSIRFYMMISM